MSTLNDLRLEAGLSLGELSRLANVDYKTAKRAEEGDPVRDAIAARLVAVLSQRLGRVLRIQDVERLQIL